MDIEGALQPLYKRYEDTCHLLSYTRQKLDAELSSLGDSPVREHLEAKFTETANIADAMGKMIPAIRSIVDEAARRYHAHAIHGVYSCQPSAERADGTIVAVFEGHSPLLLEARVDDGVLQHSEIKHLEPWESIDPHMHYLEHCWQRDGLQTWSARRTDDHLVKLDYKKLVRSAAAYVAA